MTKGRCPFAVWRGDDGMGGYPTGTPGQNRPLLFVDHIMAGWKATLDGPWRKKANVDVTFGIGRDGSLSQYTNIFDAHWGNGVTGASGPNDRRGIDRYDRSNLNLAAIEDAGTWNYSSRGFWWLAQSGHPGVSALNSATISTEHEGFPFDRAGFDATWPEAMTLASIRTKRWTIQELARYGYQMPPVNDDLLAGHFQIDAVNRGNCPGPEWPKARILSGLGVAPVAPPDDSTPSKGDDMLYVQIKGQREVYAVTGGELSHVPNPSVMTAQVGQDWPIEVIDPDDPDPARRETALALLQLPTKFNHVPNSLGGRWSQ